MQHRSTGQQKMHKTLPALYFSEIRGKEVFMKRYYILLLLIVAFFTISGSILFAEDETMRETRPVISPEELNKETSKIPVEYGQEMLDEGKAMDVGEKEEDRSRSLSLDRSSVLTSQGTTDLFALIDLVGREDSEIILAVKQFVIAQFEREQQILQERRDVLKKHYTVGMIIFVTVHIMVVMGIGAAMYELRQAHNARKRAEQQETNIQISLEGIALKTSLQGVLLLAFALAFYFLYLKFVFPVTILK